MEAIKTKQVETFDKLIKKLRYQSYIVLSTIAIIAIYGVNDLINWL